jgi:predicted ATPase
MPIAVITGGPGAGKTTLLAALRALGYATVEESARAVIVERKRSGLEPRPSPLAFAHEILRRDAEKHSAYRARQDWVFFDRCALEAVAMVHAVSALPAAELQALRRQFAVDRVFVLPPWQAIYVQDAERDQSFAEAVAVHGRVMACYRESGYTPIEVPCTAVEERAAMVLRTVGIEAP